MHFDAAGKTARTIWVIVGVLIALLILSSADAGLGWTQMAAIGALATAAFLSTAAMWGVTMAALDKSGGMTTEAVTSKNKNSARKIEKMLERLSDQELASLRDRLRSDTYEFSDDGELVERRFER